MTRVRTMHIASVMLVSLPWGCGGDRVVGENRPGAARPAMERPDAAPESGTAPSGVPAPGASSMTSLDAGPSHGFFVAAEPCDATGLIRIRETAHEASSSTRVTAAHGYVVSFDPPAVRADLTLSVAGPLEFGYAGSVDHADLPGAPDCETLRADAVFAVFELEGGQREVEFPLLNDTTSDYTDYNGSCGATVDFTVAAPADRVRIFGMIPSTHALEGPVSLTKDPSGHWKGQRTDADFPHCGDAGYLFLFAAHEGGYLVGLR
jgi:hypothetical protein